MLVVSMTLAPSGLEGCRGCPKRTGAGGGTLLGSQSGYKSMTQSPHMPSLSWLFKNSRSPPLGRLRQPVVRRLSHHRLGRHLVKRLSLPSHIIHLLMMVRSSSLSSLRIVSLVAVVSVVQVDFRVCDKRWGLTDCNSSRADASTPPSSKSILEFSTTSLITFA